MTAKGGIDTNRKALIIKVVFLVFLVSVFVAIWLVSASRASEELVYDGIPAHFSNEELLELNEALDYSVYYYDIGLGDDAEPFWNLSRTGAEEKGGASRFAAGWKILRSTDDLAALEATIQDYDASAEFPAVLESSGTTSAVYDADFFAAHELLLVDLCAEGSVDMYYYPEDLKVSGDTVSLHVRWDRANSTTADCAGQYCLITIPKGCTATDITLTHDPG